jgi:hypothetical protein
MNFQRNRAFALVLLAGALTLGASQVKAEMYKATFNLPVEAYWGEAVLSPGQYTIVIERGAASPIVHLREGTRQIASIFTGPFVNENQSQRGQLTLKQINGAYVVKTFDAGLIGKSFTFATPKVVRNRQFEAKETSRVTVDVASTH